MFLGCPSLECLIIKLVQSFARVPSIPRPTVVLYRLLLKSRTNWYPAGVLPVGPVFIPTPFLECILTENPRDLHTDTVMGEATTEQNNAAQCSANLGKLSH